MPVNPIEKLATTLGKARSPEDVRTIQNQLDRLLLEQYLEGKVHELLTKGNALRLRTFTATDESLKQLRELEARLNEIEAQGRTAANQQRQHATVGPRVIKLQ